MNTIPIAGLEQLENHLQMIVKNPETCLDEKLIDEVQLQLTEENTPIVIPKLLPLLTKILPSYPNNPASLSELSLKLLRPLDFMQILAIASEENLQIAIQSPFPSATLLGIDIISKASWAPSYTAIFSNMKRLVYALIRVWLSSPDVIVGEAATQALGDLLEVDCDCRESLSPTITSRIRDLNITSEMPLGQGLLWRRIFQDQDIYDLLFSLCSLNTPETEKFDLDNRQKSIAQGRLLRLLPRLAVLNFQIITQSQFPAVEQTYIGRPCGILNYAATEMINKKDLLMHVILIAFFGELLRLISRVKFSPSNLVVLTALVKQIASEDISLKESLEAIVRDPETAPELVELLSKLV